MHEPFGPNCVEHVCRLAEHHMNILHLFCTSGRSMFMPCSATNCSATNCHSAFSGEFAKVQINGCFRWWAVEGSNL